MGTESMPNGSISCSSAAMPLSMIFDGPAFFFSVTKSFCSDSFLTNLYHDISLLKMTRSMRGEWFKCLNLHDDGDDALSR